ncbi:putative F-box domain, leucine-rich repeat domain, L domain-containing protein [Rosa chinensis]|uniref:Putative F-box domain, leucine-rich repeat domain, L domain-containing protein n=1 Tax=Rosa chinensis TaxID=74649 RepID=A0A2P6SJY4_ROSCH|nr:putative F-box domain, leucine-rich repeat domain, L domain-containing protein [Rosa chinensis]
MAHLPDLVINQIFRLVTTKTAVRMSFVSKQWEGMLSSLPMLDFDEGGDHRFDRNDNFIQHSKFINILQKYLELCEKDREATKTTPLDKFRLRMTRYSSRDASMVYKLLSSSIERSVKVLDISLRGCTVKNYYYLCRTNLINAKTLTTLNLEYVRMKNIDSWVEPIDYSISLRLLPSLKTMSFKTVQFDHNALFFLVWECPFIEHLSLASCSFELSEIRLLSPTLKSLEIKHCKASRAELYVEDLESLSIVSSDFPLETVILERCLKLKHVNICAQFLECFFLHGQCHDVNAVIEAPALFFFSFRGHLESKFSLKAPNLCKSHIILLNEEFSSFTGQWKHFPKLKDFLQEFGSCKEMVLYVDDFEVLIFPEDFRKTLASPILADLEFLELTIENPPTYERDKQNLKDSLHWMAPALKLIESDVYLN